MAHLFLNNNDTVTELDVPDNTPTLLPRLSSSGKTFLGWSPYPALPYGCMNHIGKREATLYAVYAESAYVLESHFKGDPEDYVGNKCHMRRYVAEIYLENADASAGSFKIEHRGGCLYYIGSIPEDGIDLETDHDTHGQPYADVGYMSTSYITVHWKSREPLCVDGRRKKLVTLMFGFSRWGMGYAEIARRTSDDILSADPHYPTRIDDRPAHMSANFYNGIVGTQSRQPTLENVTVYASEEAAEAEAKDGGELLARFAVMADSHVGRRYGWESYDWLYGIFEHLEQIHRRDRLDFVLQLGDNIDDGYDASYAEDYKTYLEVIKRLSVCDPDHPIDGRKSGTVPHYEMQGNHDTSLDTRFFRNKLWFTETASGKKAAFVAFFAKYGGYPAVNFRISGNYDSYRSYGIITDESLRAAEADVIKAAESGAEQIVLLCHFGIAEDLGAPILPETGLGKIERLCKKYGIRLYFNGHEHNSAYTLGSYGGVYNYDAAMTKDKYAVFELRERLLKTTVYNTADHSVARIETIKL